MWRSLAFGCLKSSGSRREAWRLQTSCRVLNGSYKWFIWGRDDTAFFPEGVTRALETHPLDARLPYFVSGTSLWKLSGHSASPALRTLDI